MKRSINPVSYDQERPDREEKYLSPHHSSSSTDSESDVDGNLNIISIIRKLPSEARDTFHSRDSAQSNSKGS